MAGVRISALPSLEQGAVLTDSDVLAGVKATVTYKVTLSNIREYTSQPKNGGTGLFGYAAGDMIYASDTSTLLRRSIGSANQVLTVQGGVPQWANPAIAQNIQAASYTLALTDGGGHIYHPSADTAARTWTIPANSAVQFPIGTAVTFINGLGAGTITIAINTDTLILAGTGTTGSRFLAATGVATAVKVTSTSWLITGVGLT